MFVQGPAPGLPRELVTVAPLVVSAAFVLALDVLCQAVLGQLPQPLYLELQGHVALTLDLRHQDQRGRGQALDQGSGILAPDREQRVWLQFLGVPLSTKLVALLHTKSIGVRTHFPKASGKRFRPPSNL